MTGRQMPSVHAIVDYWRGHAAELDLASLLIGWSDPFCFGCSWLPPVSGRGDSWQLACRWLDRAHLADHAAGGADEPANLVMLCHLCHDTMPEHDERGAALTWVRSVPRRDWAWQLFTDLRFRHRTNVARSVTLTRARMVFLQDVMPSLLAAGWQPGMTVNLAPSRLGALRRLLDDLTPDGADAA